MNLKNFISFLSITCILILTGFLRDSVFKSINALLRSWDYGQDYFLPSFLSFLENYEYDTLMNLKWAFTLLFCMIYLVIAAIAIKLVFNKKKFVKITFLTYLGILLISALFMAVGYIFDNRSEKMYEFARYLMGMAQSPIILMLLIPAFKISEKENNKTPVS